MFCRHKIKNIFITTIENLPVSSGNNWISAQVRRPLLYNVREFLKTDAAKLAGLTNSTQFIDVAIKELMEKLQPESIVVDSIYEDRIVLQDWEAENHPVFLSVYFDKKKKPYCTYCNETDCLHVQYAWEVPEARRILKQHGATPPPSKRLKQTSI